MPTECQHDGGHQLAPLTAADAVATRERVTEIPFLTAQDYSGKRVSGLFVGDR